MKQSTDNLHFDWNIRTVVGIDNADDWKPGDPDPYFVRGIAEIAHDGDRFIYSSDQALSVDTAHFTDSVWRPENDEPCADEFPRLSPGISEATGTVQI